MTTWRATIQETHIRASFSSPHRVRWRGPGGGVGTHPAARVAPRKPSWAALLVGPDRRGHGAVVHSPGDPQHNLAAPRATWTESFKGTSPSSLPVENPLGPRTRPQASGPSSPCPHPFRLPRTPQKPHVRFPPGLGYHRANAVGPDAPVRSRAGNGRARRVVGPHSAGSTKLAGRRCGTKRSSRCLTTPSGSRPGRPICGPRRGRAFTNGADVSQRISNESLS